MNRLISFFLLAALVLSCKKNTPPEAVFTIDPASGTIDSIYKFDAGASQDAETQAGRLKFRWDWEGDGHWDTEFLTLTTAKHTYNSPGLFLIKLEVIDEEGLTDQATERLLVEIPNTPPGAVFSISPETGSILTQFVLNASLSADRESPERHLTVRWDWESDGIWDTQWTNVKTVTRQFPVIGDYLITLQVRDPEGSLGTTTRTLIVFDGNTRPRPRFVISPLVGDISTIFEFNASTSMDDESPLDQLKFRWDWESDGIWDSEYSSANLASHQFTAYGIIGTRLEVQDPGGLTDTITHWLRVTSNGIECFDKDGRGYKTVQIGNQIWMAENLAWLPAVSPLSVGSESEAFYYVYGYNGNSVSEAKGTSSYKSYGVLYNWLAAEKACPTGWHLPNDYEWMNLEMFLGMTEGEAKSTADRGSGEVGKKLKSRSGWNYNGNGDNSTGFSALPGGFRSNNNAWLNLGSTAFFWTSSKFYEHPWNRNISGYDNGVGRWHDSPALGLSLRCIKDR